MKFLLEPGEDVVKIVRRHWFVLLRVLVAIILLVLAPIFLIMFLHSGLVPIAEPLIGFVDNFVNDLGLFGYSVWLLVLWVMFFVEWTDYYLDTLVITNKRIIKIEQRQFFSREVTSYPYQQIQDITVDTSGVIETIFKFSDLHIQTAGNNHEIIVKNAATPEIAKSLILKFVEQSRAR